VLQYSKPAFRVRPWIYEHREKSFWFVNLCCPYCFEISFWAIKEKYAQPFAESERKKIGLQNFILPELRSANFRIADRTLACDFKNAFKIAEKYHTEALCAEAVSYDFTKSENWRCFLNEVRTFFDENPEN
jgi:hypothetical protein